MAAPTQKQIEALRNLNVDSVEFRGNELVDTTVSPTIIENEDGVFISGEDGKYLVDYYGEFRGGYPYINAQIEELAKRLGLMLEWNDPGSVAVYRD